MASKTDTITAKADDLDRLAREVGISDLQRSRLLEKLQAQEVENQRKGFWGRVAKVLGFTALFGGAVAGGVYLTKEAVETMPEAAAQITAREFGERGEQLKAKAEEVKEAGGVLIAKVGAFLQAIPQNASNLSTLQAGASAILQGIAGDFMDKWEKGDNSPDKTMASMDQFLSNDPALAPYWTAITAAYEELKKKADALVKLEGVLDVTETDKKEAWNDYKRILWDNIKQDFHLKSKEVPTSSPAQGSPE